MCITCFEKSMMHTGVDQGACEVRLQEVARLDRRRLG